MTKRMRGTLAAAAMAAALPAIASYHTMRIREIFSNGDGTIQYVVLQESMGEDGENLLGGHTLTATEGATTRVYTFAHDLPGGSCDYYGMCMPAPTANRYVLIGTAGFAALSLVKPDYVMPNGFVPLSGSLDYAGVDVVTYASLPTDGVSAIDRAGAMVPNVATNFSGGSASVAAAVMNFQGLWWAAPAASESGWGLNVAHQADTLFVTWFTYDADGKGWWLVMTGDKIAPGSYRGKLYTTRGPAFNASPWDPTAVDRSEAGTGTLTFTDANTGTFNYVIGATNQTRNITREVFGPLPTCTWGGMSMAAATNYQDLWWKQPAGSESGWGINFAHEGDTIFATWFTYDLAGAPLWLVATATKTAPGVYSGDLFRTSGPPYNVLPFDPTKVTKDVVGTVTFTFGDGNDAIMESSVQLAGMMAPVVQSKAITREIFAAPGTACR